MKVFVADSPGELAKHIGDALNNHHGDKHYRRLPYNRFDDYLNHLTWLVPGPEQVAFRRSKFFFDWLDQDAGEIWFGVHLEKGVSRLAARSKSDKCVMTPDWSWHSVFPEFGNASMQTAINSVNEAIGKTGQLKLMLSPYCEGIGRDKIQENTFSFAADKLVHEKASGHQELKRLSKCESLTDVREAILNWPESEWFWVDLLLGFRAKIEARPGVNQIVQAEDMAPMAFIPFEKWVH